MWTLTVDSTHYLISAVIIQIIFVLLYISVIIAHWLNYSSYVRHCSLTDTKNIPAGICFPASTYRCCPWAPYAIQRARRFPFDSKRRCAKELCESYPLTTKLKPYSKFHSRGTLKKRLQEVFCSNLRAGLMKRRLPCSRCHVLSPDFKRQTENM